MFKINSTPLLGIFQFFLCCPTTAMSRNLIELALLTPTKIINMPEVLKYLFII